MLLRKTADRRYNVQKHLDDITGNNLSFSLATEASNNATKQDHTLEIFSFTEGSNSQETSDAIAKQLLCKM